MALRHKAEAAAWWRSRGHDGDGISHFVEAQFRAYLRCGILAHGFADHASRGAPRCSGCGHDFLVAFACKGRGICPSCNSRRMAATAAHLTDHVIPAAPVRQWVLSAPKCLRYFLHRDPKAAGAVLHIVLRALRPTLHDCSPGVEPEARFGAVSFLHRFGASLNPRFHSHLCVLDGVHEAAASPWTPRSGSPPTTGRAWSGCSGTAPGRPSP